MLCLHVLKTSAFALLLALCCATNFAHANKNAKTSKSILKQARQWLKQNKCEQVIKELNSKDFTKGLDNESLFIDYYHILGACYFKINDIKNAQIEYSELLYINPNYKLDPFSTPPALMDLFSQIKKNVKDKSSELSRAKDQATNKTQPIERETVYHKTSMLVSFMPFGAGQFQNGQTLKGSLVAASQTTFLLGNIGFYWWKRALVNSGNIKSNLGLFNTAQTLQFVAIGAFAAVYVYSIIDALVNREDLILQHTSVKSSETATRLFLHELNNAKKRS